MAKATTTALKKAKTLNINQATDRVLALIVSHMEIGMVDPDTLSEYLRFITEINKVAIIANNFNHTSNNVATLFKGVDTSKLLKLVNSDE